MIITDKFVFLHFAKNGGTFVTEVLKKVHSNMKKMENFLLPNIRWKGSNNNEYTPHNSYQQIPEEHKNKPVISTIRNPFDRYVSLYEFRQWVRQPRLDVKIIKEHFPSYPDLDFKQYLQFLNTLILQQMVYSDELKLDIGSYTFGFIKMFFKNPEQIIQNLNESYLISNNYTKDMPKIIFLRTENLNQDLFNALLNFGYAEKDIAFILKEEKSYPGGSTRGTLQKWEQYYTDELFEYVKWKDRFLLRVFPEYNV
ncbi:MAG: hypothetical protein A2169_07340 [Deltaproteobacteria bacterium RBG_13_47_9]|nr:MAG: hypothetical protein A2169_07340 [Deltaproteobacteria bacterium RBG_13_47_9]